MLRGLAMRQACSTSSAGVASCSSRPAVGGAPRQASWRLRSIPQEPTVLGRRDVSRAFMLGALSSIGLGRPAGRVCQAAQQSEIEQVLADPKWPPTFPFTDDAFGRYDESADSEFYSYPRLVTHIDDAAIESLTKFYAEMFPPSGSESTALLDVCSSWVSHYPPKYKAGKISGLGMNKEELAKNPALTDFSVKDLNVDPTLPYPDNSYDVITNCVSVDYLTKPMQVFQEMHRCLKPGGLAIMSFSNRCFPTKAIALWTQTADPDHVWIVGSYFHYSVPGGYTPPQAKDITKKRGKTDPMYVVYARKQTVQDA